MSDSSELRADHEAEVSRLEREISMLLRRSRSAMKVMAGRVHPAVDAASYTVLLTIARTEPLRLVELAEEIGLDKSTMSRQVTALTKLGLVRRRPDPDDGRAFLLELSDEGEQQLAELSRQRHDAWLERLDDWSTEEIASLADGLTKLAALIAAPAPHRPAEIRSGAAVGSR
jgi:DNA-binding MarR family transcriptional regulator